MDKIQTSQWFLALSMRMIVEYRLLRRPILVLESRGTGESHGPCFLPIGGAIKRVPLRIANVNDYITDNRPPSPFQPDLM